MIYHSHQHIEEDPHIVPAPSCRTAAAALNTKEVLVIVDDPSADSGNGKLSSGCQAETVANKVKRKQIKRLWMW